MEPLFKLHIAVLVAFVIAIMGMAIDGGMELKGLFPLALIVAIAITVAYGFGYEKREVEKEG